MAKGWLDNYGEQENYNDSKTSVPKGFVGQGYDTSGRNYSPAWGGQFQEGGIIPIVQEGTQTISSKDKRGIDLLIKETEKAKKDKNELQSTGKIKNPRSIAYSSKVKKQPELKQDRRTDYEREYDNKKGKSKELKRKVIGTADELTDLMQIGNFIPHPYAQTVGEAGNILGAGIDAYQAAEDFSEGDYESAAINAGSAILPMFIERSGYTRDMYNTNPNSLADKIASFGNRSGSYIPLTTLPNAVAPSTIKGVNYNRTLLGGLGAESLYDKPKYQIGGNVYPVNYVPQAQMGASIPGAVGFSYARTQGAAPSNGPYAKKTMASAQNGQEMEYYKNGLDWKPKSISKQGSIIKDDMGQWAHPGEITEIESSDITMEGVPYDVLGISDTGDTKLMKPGKNYKFKGKKVTEYPMAKNGLRQEQKGLENLDQLTNFTNYNTKQPGGWLDNL